MSHVTHWDCDNIYQHITWKLLCLTRESSYCILVSLFVIVFFFLNNWGCNRTAQEDTPVIMGSTSGNVYFRGCLSCSNTPVSWQQHTHVSLGLPLLLSRSFILQSSKKTWKVKKKTTKRVSKGDTPQVLKNYMNEKCCSLHVYCYLLLH